MISGINLFQFGLYDGDPCIDRHRFKKSNVNNFYRYAAVDLRFVVCSKAITNNRQDAKNLIPSACISGRFWFSTNGDKYGIQ